MPTLSSGMSPRPEPRRLSSSSSRPRRAPAEAGIGPSAPSAAAPPAAPNIVRLLKRPCSLIAGHVPIWLQGLALTHDARRGAPSGQLDLALDQDLSLDALNGHGGSRGKRLVALQLAGVEPLPDPELDLALSGDPDPLQEAPHRQVESLFVHAALIPNGSVRVLLGFRPEVVRL